MFKTGLCFHWKREGPIDQPGLPTSFLQITGGSQGEKTNGIHL